MHLSTLLNAEYLLHTYGYVGIFLVVFLESGIFFGLPGDSLLFTAGLLASTAGFNLYLLIPLIFLATFLGGIAGYGVGLYLESLHRYALWRKILKPEYILDAHKFFERHGKLAVILSRFVPIARTFVPIAAGVARMSKGAFLRYSVLSSLLWSVIVTLLGYFLGQAFPQIKDYLSYFIIGIVFVSLVPVVLGWLRERSRRLGTK